MKNTNLPTWVQPLVIGLGTATFSIFMSVGIKKMSELNTSINRFNVINENIYGKLEVIHTEIQSLKAFRETTQQENKDRDRTLARIEQQVGIIEERIKVKQK